MASYRLNIARIQGCPPPAEVCEALAEFGLPADEEFGVLDQSEAGHSAFATIARRIDTTVDDLDEATGEVTARPVRKVVVYPFGVRPAAEFLEIYAGPAGIIEHVARFFSTCLALPTVVSAIEIDLPSAVGKLARATKHFQLRSIRVAEYAHNAYMSGPYGPKFLDTEQGIAFLDEYADFVTSASVRFAAPTGRATATFPPKACFGFSCNEDDRTEVRSILRKLI